MRNTLRLATVQMHYWPAYRTQNRDFIDYPQFFSDDTFKLLQGRNAALGKYYCKHFEQTLSAILKQCARWKADVVLFPEYCIPFELLEVARKASSRMTIVASSHLSNAKSDEYLFEFGATERTAKGVAISPVFCDGKLVHIQHKLIGSPAENTEQAFTRGTKWGLVPLSTGHSEKWPRKTEQWNKWKLWALRWTEDGLASRS